MADQDQDTTSMEKSEGRCAYPNCGMFLFDAPHTVGCQQTSKSTAYCDTLRCHAFVAPVEETTIDETPRGNPSVLEHVEAIDGALNDERFCVLGTADAINELVDIVMASFPYIAEFVRSRAAVTPQSDPNRSDCVCGAVSLSSDLEPCIRPPHYDPVHHHPSRQWKAGYVAGLAAQVVGASPSPQDQKCRFAECRCVHPERFHFDVPDEDGKTFTHTACQLCVYGHAELLCEDCGRDYVVWFAPNDVWNAVMRRGDRETSGPEPFLCAACFTFRADAEGLAPTGWLVTPDPQPSRAVLAAAQVSIASPSPQPQAAAANGPSEPAAVGIADVEPSRSVENRPSPTLSDEPERIASPSPDVNALAEEIANALRRWRADAQGGYFHDPRSMEEMLAEVLRKHLSAVSLKDEKEKA